MSDVLARVTESRTDPTWGREPAAVPNLGWFDGRSYTPAKLSTGHGTEREWYAYGATTLIVKGTCAADPVAEAMRAEGLAPVLDPDGKAMACIWFNVLHDSVCGRYHEIVVSFDATTAPDGARAEFRSSADPFGYLYDYFGSTACERAFLHSLYINSPLSIAWGREMQSFPKHPDPVASTLSDEPDRFRFDIAWGEDALLRGELGKRWGAGAFASLSLGLLRNFGPVAVTRFLAGPDFDVRIRMPRATAEQHGNGADYVAALRKGLSPVAVRAWPWTEADRLELGEAVRPTGCEEGNAHALLRRAGFEPRIGIYLPFLQAHVAPAT